MTFNALIRYEWSLANGMLATASMDANFNDQVFKDVDNLLETDTYWLGNARLSVSDTEDRWAVAAWIKNIGENGPYLLSGKEYLWCTENQWCKSRIPLVAPQVEML